MGTRLRRLQLQKTNRNLHLVVMRPCSSIVRASHLSQISYSRVHILVLLLSLAQLHLLSTLQWTNVSDFKGKYRASKSTI